MDLFWTYVQVLTEAKTLDKSKQKRDSTLVVSKDGSISSWNLLSITKSANLPIQTCQNHAQTYIWVCK